MFHSPLPVAEQLLIVDGIVTAADADDNASKSGNADLHCNFVRCDIPVTASEEAGRKPQRRRVGRVIAPPGSDKALKGT
jgi:hypothetical protein